MTEDTQRAVAIDFDEFLRNALSGCRDAGLSFALWRLPATTTVHFAASLKPVTTHDVNLEETEPGFLFAPFDPGKKKVFLPADESFRYESGQLTVLKGEFLDKLQSTKRDTAKDRTTAPHYATPHPAQTSIDQVGYQQLVARCRDEVLNGSFEKVVPSRFKEVPLPKDFDAATLFTTLCTRYPSAMVSVFSSPLTGTWIGATPEMLVSVDAQQHFHTVAVAGTQRYVPGMDLRAITWTQKEIEEQALVERYIINCFKKIRLREFEERGPRTVVAGNVVHLKTEFEVDMVATRYPQLGTVMLQLLHPTSAVCGMPLEGSLAFLKEHEGYDRQFYSGYLGPRNVDQETHLFVNLRCMQVASDTALVYAGAGVLGDSDPEKEWQETELKMRTLLDVIRD